MNLVMRQALVPFFFLVSSALAAYACGGSTTGGGGSGGDAGGASDASMGAGDASSSGDGSGGGTEGGGGACFIPPPGTMFTFHVHNVGSNALALSYGCGGTLPIMLATPGGTLGIGPGPADGCEITCASQYAGPVQEGCSDCGPGVGAALPAGGTVDIAWDRRVYVAHVADPTCVGGMAGVSCALAEAVAPTASQSGTISYCSGSGCGGSSSGASSSGGGAMSESASFLVDTTAGEATIAVQ
jgi:hypothetical protein